MKGILSTLVLLLLVGGVAATDGASRAWAGDPPTDALDENYWPRGDGGYELSTAGTGEEDPDPPPPWDRKKEGDPTDGMEGMQGDEGLLIWDELLMQLLSAWTLLP